jgi:hypothetical protein
VAITLGVETAHPNLAPADYAAAETSPSVQPRQKFRAEDFENNQAFWDIFFRKTEGVLFFVKSFGA